MTLLDARRIRNEVLFDPRFSMGGVSDMGGINDAGIDQYRNEYSKREHSVIGVHTSGLHTEWRTVEEWEAWKETNAKL